MPIDPLITLFTSHTIGPCLKVLGKTRGTTLTNCGNGVRKKGGEFAFKFFQNRPIGIFPVYGNHLLKNDVSSIDTFIDIVNGQTNLSFAVNNRPIDHVATAVKWKFTRMAVYKSIRGRIQNWGLHNLVVGH